MGFSSRRVRPRALGAFCLSLALGLGVSETARAAPKTAEARAVESARTLFYRALSLQDHGKWAEALEILENVAETRESAQVRFNIAFNQEHLGRLAAAARGYERAISLAGQAGADNVIHAANERLQSLSHRVARLVVRPAAEGVEVTLDGVSLASRDWGRALPVEVGDHTVAAQATGHRPYRVSVNLPGGETRELRIELEPIREEAPPPLAAEGPQRAVSAPPEPPPRPRTPPARQDRESKPSSLPYIAGGAAVLSVATAGVFYALRQDALDDMHSRCRDGRCPADLRSTDRSGALYTTVANVALASGVGLAGVSAGLFISQIDASDERRRDVSVRASVSSTF